MKAPTNHHEANRKIERQILRAILEHTNKGVKTGAEVETTVTKTIVLQGRDLLTVDLATADDENISFPSEFSKLPHPFSKYIPSHSNKITRTHCITHSTYTRFKINYFSHTPSFFFFQKKKKCQQNSPLCKNRKFSFVVPLFCVLQYQFYSSKNVFILCVIFQRCSQHQKSPTILSHFRYILANILFPN